MRKKCKLVNYFIYYTILFCAVSFFAFLPFILYHKSVIFKVDAQPQYIVYLRYMGEYLRQALRNLLQGNLTPVMYDFTIGMGDDVNAIVRSNPFNFLSVFVPPSGTEVLYTVILMLNYYLSGISFCAFALYLSGRDVQTSGASGVQTSGASGVQTSGASGDIGGIGEDQRLPELLPGQYRIDPVNILSGAMVYVFTGFMLIRVMNHPATAISTIFLPLLLLGVEKVMRGEGYIFFCVVTALGFISNYYFMYIISIALAVYVLVRIPWRREKKHVFIIIFRLFFLYMLGLGLSMVTLLPSLSRYLSSYRALRINSKEDFLFYKDKRRYVAWILNLIAPYVSSGNGTGLNFAVTVFPTLVILFSSSKKKFSVLKKSIIAELICLLVPLGGYVLAVFNNENNRWVFLIAMSLGMCVVLMVDRLGHLSRREIIFLCASAVLYILLAAAAMTFTSFNWYYFASSLELAVFIFIIILLNKVRASSFSIRRAVLAMTCVSVVIGAVMTYHPSFGGYVNSCEDAFSTDSLYQSAEGASVLDLKDDSFFRVSTSGTQTGMENAGIYLGYNGTAMYNSILNRALVEGLVSEDNVGLDAVTHLLSLDGRFTANNLAAVKYYATTTEGMVPEGFSQDPVEVNNGVYVYENENPFPLGWTCDSFIYYEDYNSLDAVSRELVKLDAVVIEDGYVVSSLDRVTESSSSVLKVDVALPEEGNNAVMTQDGYLITQRYGSFKLTYEKKEGYVCYLMLKGLSSDIEKSKIRIKSDGNTKAFTLRSAGETYTLAREDYLIDLMCQSEVLEDGENIGKVKVSFQKSGNYRLEGAEIYYIPVNELKTSAMELTDEPMIDIQMMDNTVKGSVNVSQEKMLVFSIPYSSGWSLKVDGESASLIQADLCYMGTLLEEGSHEIELTYVTPGLKAGFIVSVLSFLVLLCVAIYLRKKKAVTKKQKNYKRNKVCL